MLDLFDTMVWYFQKLFLYVERSKNLEKKYVRTVQKIHLPKGVWP